MKKISRKEHRDRGATRNSKLTISGISVAIIFSIQTATAEEKSAPPYEKRWEERPFAQKATSCFNCHETLSGRWGRPAREHVTSAHFRASVACNECHGGDPTQDDTDGAHSVEKGFVGKLDHDKMIDRCGKCHATEVKTFVASKHFPEHEGVRRVSCMICHGAHDIGARPESSDWTKTCAQCHELDNVPKLPKELIAMTTSKDAMQSKLRQLRYKLQNKPYPPAIMESYRKVRQLSADVVHATKAKGIGPVMESIIAKNKTLEDKISAEVGP